MKKKIKDLTYEEAKEICYKNSNCNKCPLNFVKKEDYTSCYLDKLACDKYTTEHELNQEIEIDEK